MGLLGALIPWWARWAAIALLCIACAGYGALKMNEHDWRVHGEVVREYAEFRAKVLAEAKAAGERSASLAAHYEMLAEEANNDHQAALDALRARVKRLRDERDRDGGGRVPAAAACPSSADGADRRGEFELAYGELLRAVREEAFRCDQAVTALNAAKLWAAELQKGEAK